MSASVSGTAGLNASTTTLIILPGNGPGGQLSQTIDVPANNSVLIHTDGGLAPTASTNGITSVVDVVLVVDGQILGNGGWRRFKATNLQVTNAAVTTTVGFENWSFEEALDLTPGPHTISVAAGLSPQQANPAVPMSSTAATISGNSGSVLQAVLTVTIVKK